MREKYKEKYRGTIPALKVRIRRKKKIKENKLITFFSTFREIKKKKQYLVLHTYKERGRDNIRVRNKADEEEKTVFFFLLPLFTMFKILIIYFYTKIGKERKKVSKSHQNVKTK